MCGIAGLVQLSGLTDNSALQVRNMVNVIRHRGPDEQGYFEDRHAALGHARLSIIDLSCGRQPLSNEDGTVWITFNGEIYNFAELREELIAKGHKFRTRTDTETIVHLYEEEGDECVARLRGMFAFTIWDQKRQRALLARDRLGKKPLYFGLFRGRLAFASEIKAILQLPDWPRDVDHEALLDYLTFGWIPAPKSIFRNVRKLPAAYVAVFDRQGFREREYWNFDDTDSFECSEEELCEQFREQLYEATRIRMVSDVPLGAFLSGGLDSSAVVATMAGLSDKPVITNSIGFEEREFSELEHANLVATRFATDHRRQVVLPDAANILDTLSWHWDEPFADSSAIPTYYVSKMARESVTVALSGDGGDENMAGYRRYKFSQRLRSARRLVPSAGRRAVSALGHLYPKADWLPRILRAKSTLLELGGTDVEAIFRARSLLQPEISWGLLSADLRRQLVGYSSREVIDYHYKRSPIDDPLGRELYVDIKTYLVDDILTKVDRASMAVSLEVRSPLLDHKMVEFMARIPSRLKLHKGEGKYLFKQAFRPVLGPEIVDRRKMGFSIPLNKWLRGPLSQVVEDCLFSPSARVRSWLDMEQLKRHWKALQSGHGHRESLIWSALMLEGWAEKHLPPL